MPDRHDVQRRRLSTVVTRPGIEDAYLFLAPAWAVWIGIDLVRDR